MYTLRSEQQRDGVETPGVLLLLSDSRLSNDFDRLRLSLCWGRIAKAKAIDQGHPVYSGRKAKETTSGTARATNLAKAAAARLRQRVSPFRGVWPAGDTCLLFAAQRRPRHVCCVCLRRACKELYDLQWTIHVKLVLKTFNLKVIPTVSVVRCPWMPRMHL